MEIRELLKSFLRGKLSPEMPQVFLLLGSGPQMETGPERSPYSFKREGGAAPPDWSCESSTAGCTPEHHRVQFRKAFFFLGKCI